MPKIDVFNKDNKPVGKVDLPADMFSVEVRRGLLHEVVCNYLANQRQGTAETKTRARVRGGGRKPYRQKGTGRARAGSNRSPLWKGGGTVFGPQYRDYSYRLPKKVKWAALGAALSAKLADGEVVVVEDISVSEPKTREFVSLLKGLGLRNVLVVLPEDSRAVRLSARNIPHVDVAIAGRLNVYDILSHEKLLLTQKAVERMKEVYLG
jgi:large subunit ribosomal protein L4